MKQTLFIRSTGCLITKCNCRSGASEASEGTTLYNRTIKRFSDSYVLKAFSGCAEFVANILPELALTQNWCYLIGN